MKTISFKIKVDKELQKVISEDSRVYSDMYRYSFNRFQEGLSGKEVYAKVAKLFPDMNCHLRNSA